MTKFRMEDWVSSLKLHNPLMAASLETDRVSGFRAVENMGLPHYERRMIPLDEFMDNPELFAGDMDCDTFYVTLVPKMCGRRFSEADLDVSHVISFVREHLDEKDYTCYNMALQQYFDNKFGGNIIVNKDGSLLAEFRRGRQGPIGSGTEIPEFYITRNMFTNSFRYSFESPELRQLLYSTFLIMPHEGEGREMRFVPGYYEFVIVNKRGRLKPVFIDYKGKGGYKLPDNFQFL